MQIIQKWRTHLSMQVGCYVKVIISLADTVYWKDLVASEDPLRHPLPSRYEDSLTEFKKLIVRKIIKDENIMIYIKEFIRKEQSEEFIESPAFDLVGAYSDSTSTFPIIFILSPGADPIPNLVNLAKQKGMEERLKILSSRQGQGVIVQKYIEGSQANWEWIYLQNCYLSSSWMPELERMQETITEENINPEYRFWLTLMYFCISCSSASKRNQNNKWTTEGFKSKLKANILRSRRCKLRRMHQTAWVQKDALCFSILPCRYSWKTKVWSNWLEHSLWVDELWFLYVSSTT